MSSAKITICSARLGAGTSNSLAYLAFAVLGLIWGSNFIFVKWAAALISPAQIVLLRVLFGFVPVFVFALATKSLKWSHMQYAQHFLVMALLATAFYYFAFAKGTALLPSSVAGMLSGAIPLFTFVTAWLFLRGEPINRKTVGGTLLGFIGVIMIAAPWTSGAGSINLEGVLYMIAGSFSVGASFVYAKKYIIPLGLPALALTTYQIGFGLVILLLVTNTSGVTAVFSDWKATAGLIGGLGLCGTGLAYILYYFIVQRLGAISASGVTYIPPLVALAIGAVWVGENVTLLHVVAMTAILAGVWLLQAGKKVLTVELCDLARH